MTLILNNPAIQRLIDERVTSGKYASAEDVVAAALVSLKQQENAGDFEPGELDELIEVGRIQADHGELIDADDVFREIEPPIPL